MEREQFEQELTAALPKIRGVIRRMVGNAEETEDLVQNALLRAVEKRESYRGESSVSTWLVSIATRITLNHLRSRKRWEWNVQDEIAKELHGAPESRSHVMSLVASPASRFDAREHIAFCFTCVGRSLDPDKQVALILRDVCEYTNREASKIVGVTESVLRARLAKARTQMQASFEDLCGLINKDGVCHQCKGLRQRANEDNRGAATPDLAAAANPDGLYQLRVRQTRGVNLESGVMQEFHDYVWQQISRFENDRLS